jgi:hypothetical protein
MASRRRRSRTPQCNATRPPCAPRGTPDDRCTPPAVSAARRRARRPRRCCRRRGRTPAPPTSPTGPTPPRLSSRPPCTRGCSSRRLHGQRKRNKRTRRQFPTPCAAKEKEKSLKAAESGRRSRPCSTVLSKTASAMRVETEASMEGSGFSVGKERTAGIGWRFEEWPIATAPEMEGI